MDLFLLACQRVLVMLLLMAVGFVLFKIKKISAEGSRDLGNMLVFVILPCVVLRAFWTERTPERTSWLLWSFLLSAGVLAISIIIAKLLFRKSPVDNAGTAFCNAGFMGVPMIQAVLGQESLIFGVPFIAELNILQFTYGAAVLTGDRRNASFKKVLKAPVLLCTVIGLICYFTQVKLPGIVTTTIGAIAEMNTPVAMIILGVYLAQADLKSLFTNGRMYLNALPRLVLIPLITVFLLALLPDSLDTAGTALVVVSCAPVGALTAVYAQLYGLDYTYACSVICISTIMSVITMPLIIMLSSVL